jgi:glycosyltransferase involved in cell wall biosynthesis
MHRFKVALILQVYNEVESGHLERFLKYNLDLADFIIIYDDASTDGTYERCLEVTPHVIRGKDNEFEAEVYHKSLLLERAKLLNADFVLWLDSDEVLSTGGRDKIEQLCQQCIDEDLDALEFQMWNLWRSTEWKRTDTLFDQGWFPRLWRIKSDTRFIDTKKGLHQANVPQTIKKKKRTTEVAMLHFGFASLDYILRKFLVYRSHGMAGFQGLRRLIDESHLKLELVPREKFPKDLYQSSEKPNPIARHCHDFTIFF